MLKNRSSDMVKVFHASPASAAPYFRPEIFGGLARIHPLLPVIASPRNEGVAIQLKGCLRRCAPAYEHVFVITSLAPPGVVIQLDGHGAKRLAMTFSGFIAAVTQTAGLAAGSPNDDKKQCEPASCGSRMLTSPFSRKFSRAAAET
jgi:hypothetical protein